MKCSFKIISFNRIVLSTLGIYIYEYYGVSIYKLFLLGTGKLIANAEDYWIK